MLNLFELTFGQRIELGKAFEQIDKEPVECYKTVMRIFGRKERMSRDGYSFFVQVADALADLARKERRMLSNEPTAEEKSAGISEYLKNVGEMATVKSIAKAYSRDPDEVLQWKYGKVFGIMYADLEESKFQKRYEKVIENKYRHKRK